MAMFARMRNFIRAKTASIKQRIAGKDPEPPKGVAVSSSPSKPAVPVATQKESKTKVLASEYKPFNKDLKKNLTDILNALPASHARNALIRKIERMDVVKLNELYYDKPDLFNVYFAYDSDAYTDGLEYESDEEGLGGFTDLITVYERKYNVSLGD